MSAQINQLLYLYRTHALEHDNVAVFDTLVVTVDITQLNTSIIKKTDNCIMKICDFVFPGDKTYVKSNLLSK